MFLLAGLGMVCSIMSLLAGLGVVCFIMSGLGVVCFILIYMWHNRKRRGFLLSVVMLPILTI